MNHSGTADAVISSYDSNDSWCKAPTASKVVACHDTLSPRVATALSLCWSLVRSLLAASLGSVQAVLALQQEAALRQQRVWLLALLG
jgi:hypothetical protein